MKRKMFTEEQNIAVSARAQSRCEDRQPGLQVRGLGGLVVQLEGQIRRHGRAPDAALRSRLRELANEQWRFFSMTAKLLFDSDALGELCRRHRICRLSLFGSTLKGTAGPDSDIDLLVEFERDAKPGLFDLANIENELSNLLGGRRVDLRTPEDLSRYFRDEVVREAAVQYESA
jgi:predicted nucleotidyltransferase